MKLHTDEGPPCRNMESLLQGVADGSLRGWRKWYAVAHATRCSHCGTFLERLKETLGKLHEVKREAAPSDDVMARLKQGTWREALSGEDES